MFDPRPLPSVNMMKTFSEGGSLYPHQREESPATAREDRTRTREISNGERAVTNPDVHAESKSKGWHPEHWVSLVPYGVDQTIRTPTATSSAALLRTAIILLMRGAFCAMVAAMAAP